jgi:hypothetical protein
MSNDPEKSPELKISRGSPESFGWQRRPEYDTQTGLAYEKPTGDLMSFPRYQKPALVRLGGRTLRDCSPKA